MDDAILRELLVTYRQAYVLVADDLRVVATAGSLDMLGNDMPIAPGTPLATLLPELAGSESVIADVVAGALPQCQWEHINRPVPGGDTAYITVTLLPYRGPQAANLLVLVADTTNQGQYVQLLAQKHNDLRLVQRAQAQQNNELAIANNELARVNEAKTVFMSMAAHELNNPLAAIMGYIELLLDDAYGEVATDQREVLQLVRLNVDRLHMITLDLLDMSRIESGRVELTLRPLDLRELVHSVVATYQVQLRSRGQSLSVVVNERLPIVLCDEVRAGQIIGNLLSNAIKYTPLGGQITVSLGPDQEEGFARVIVQDTGVGIAPEDQHRVFERFFRGRHVGIPMARGSGLGLYITSLLVELHGGKVWYESELHVGSTFFVTFLTAEAPIPPATSAVPAHALV